MAFKSDKKYDRPILKLYQPDDSYKVQPLPKPSGAYPYRLDAAKFVQLPHDAFSFHMVGDTGGMRYQNGQQSVAEQMSKQATEGVAKPAFLYHLGDVVYHFGEAEYYERQFFKPYSGYPGPIFAIAGNHDSDVNPSNPVPYNSLDAFTAVFCDSESRDISFSTSKTRKSVTQPHVYWTLQTPLANIIGLHSNVPKYGFVDEAQRKWFVEELKAAVKERPGKMILVCIHHAPYTADFNHGSSEPMIEMLESAYAESGVLPDAVFSGHVHNYQRYHKTYNNGKVVPYIVCGAGGFDELHSLVYEGDPMYTTDSPLLDGVQLQSYCDDKHGFLKISLERKGEGVTLKGEYFVLNNKDEKNTTIDSVDAFII
ncbi:metallophosphoesterase family protein [Flavobacterium sp. RHBU_3]|uniref:metallophosphoesterase family protein n=1 Tax=Flavobacterium sp. RHBU_3 TaxID=3391184 RepID=UPI003985327D